MQYFSYISNSYVCKNKLEKEILYFLQQNNRQVMDWSTADHFKAQILSGIDILNKSNPRCKPFKAEWGDCFTDEKDYHLYLGGSICNFHLYRSAS